MAKKTRRLVLCSLAVLTALAAIGITWATNVTARRATINDREAGEVVVDDQVVMRFLVSMGRLSPAERANEATRRLNDALEQDSTWQQFSVEATHDGNAIYAGDRLITVVTRADADAAETNIAELAYDWRDNLIAALGGEPPVRYANSRSRKGYYSDWEGARTKWVPILDVNNNGLRIGAAQVAGPEVQVDKVKAVALLGLDFRNTARIKVYIPIDTLNVTRLNRVQGVSVWATGDLKIVGF